MQYPELVFALCLKHSPRGFVLCTLLNLPTQLELWTFLYLYTNEQCPQLKFKSQPGTLPCPAVTAAAHFDEAWAMPLVGLVFGPLFSFSFQACKLARRSAAPQGGVTQGFFPGQRA